MFSSNFNSKAILFVLLFFTFNASLVPAKLDHAAHIRELNNDPIGPLDTNAKRLAAHLPPLPVARKRASRTDTAKRTSPSLSTVSYSGVISVKNLGGSTLGYIATVPNSAGGYTMSNILGASTFTFNALASGSTSNLLLYDSTNNYANTPYLGGVVTSSTNLESGSSNAAFLAATQATPAGSAPVSTNYQTTTIVGGSAESAIWTYDETANLFTAQWENFDGTAIDASVVYNPGTGLQAKTGALVLVGDATAYLTSYPNAKVVTLSLLGI